MKRTLILPFKSRDDQGNELIVCSIGLLKISANMEDIQRGERLDHDRSRSQSLKSDSFEIAKLALS